MIYLHTIYMSTSQGVDIRNSIPFVDPALIGVHQAVKKMHALCRRLKSEISTTPLMLAFPPLVEKIVEQVRDSDEFNVTHGSYESTVIRRVGGTDIVEVRPHRLFGGGILVYQGSADSGIASLFWLGPEKSNHAMTHQEWIEYLFGDHVSCADIDEALRLFGKKCK
jgi:hypothetical protein